MNSPDLTGGQIVIFLLIGLAIVAAYPFIKAFLIYYATRTMKFKKLSYWKSFFCVLIGIGIMTVIQMIIMGIAFQPGHEFNPDTILESNTKTSLLGLFLVPIAEAISIYIFFKESIGKSLGALALTYLFAIALLIVLFIVFMVLMFLIRLAGG